MVVFGTLRGFSGNVEEELGRGHNLSGATSQRNLRITHTRDRRPLTWGENLEGRWGGRAGDVRV